MLSAMGHFSLGTSCAELKSNEILPLNEYDSDSGTALSGAINCKIIVDAGWPVCVTYRSSWKGICSLTGPCEMELTGSILLIQRLIAFITCDSCQKLQVEEGTSLEEAIKLSRTDLDR